MTGIVRTRTNAHCANKLFIPCPLLNQDLAAVRSASAENLTYVLSVVGGASREMLTTHRTRPMEDLLGLGASIASPNNLWAMFATGFFLSRAANLLRWHARMVADLHALLDLLTALRHQAGEPVTSNVGTR